MHMPLVLTNRRRRGGSASAPAFSPTSLYSSGSQGIWLDPSDLTTMFSDRAGTTPVTTPGTVVGLRLDKSKGLTLGAELVTNGDFASSSNWAALTGTLKISGGALTVALGDRIYQAGVLPSGSPTVLLADVSLAAGGSTTGNVLVLVGTITYRFTFSASSAAGGRIQFRSNDVSDTTAISVKQVSGEVVVDNISVRELAGNHAQAPTDAARPTYGVEPKGGRRNLLTWSEGFNDSVWVKSNGAVTADADGIYDRFTPTAATATPNIGVVSGPFVVGTNTVSVDFKASGVPWGRIRIATGTVGGVASTGARPGLSFANFDLSSGAVGAVGAGGGTSSIQSLGSGYYRCTYNFSCTTAGTLVVQFMAIQSDSTADFPSFTWNGTDSLLIGRGQAEASSTATAYQRVTTAYDVTESGVATCHYVQYDGSDDSMSTAAIDFTATDKMSVFAGVRKISDAADACLVELSASAGSNNGSFNVFTGPTPSAPNRYSSFTKGSAGFVIGNWATTNIGNAPDAAVLATTHDIAGDLTTIRRNGVAGTSATVDLGSGNFGTYPLFIGRRNNSVAAFNGKDYGIIVVGKTASAGEITDTETWLAAKTSGVTL